jgi:hypothetical protein
MRNNQRRLGPDKGSSSSSPAPNIAELAFAVPTEFVELPSKGEFYSKDHPLLKQETVEIKFMTAKDEDILSSKPLLKKGLALERLLENLLVLNIDPKTLFVSDRNASLVAARVSGYGSEYNFSHSCSNCFHASEISFDLQDATYSGGCFDEKFLHEEKIFYNDDTSTLDVTLPTSGVTVGLEPIDCWTEKKLFSENKTNEEAPVTSVLSSFITKVNDNADYNYIIQFIEAMPVKDSKYLRDLYGQLMPNLRLIHHFMCKECYNTKELEVPLNAGFFWS